MLETLSALRLISSKAAMARKEVKNDNEEETTNIL